MRWLSGSEPGGMGEDFCISDLVRENIRNLVPYASARDDFPGTASVFLDANENPHNPPLNRYPDPRQAVLKRKIASLKSQEPRNLFLGNGSDEGIDLLFRVLCVPGRDNVITVDPTYGMYGVCADINDVERRSVQLREDFSLDPGRILDAVDQHTRMIFLCSPNNPTSNSFDGETVTDLIDRAPCMVVVDEAYIDFSSQPGQLQRVPEQKNLVVLQTLSKAWGLAGIRLGMVFAHPELVAYLSAVKYPYNLNTLSINRAMEALAGGQDRKAAWIREIIGERERLTAALGNFPFVDKVYPSDANFLLVRTSDPGAIYSFLVGKGIIVRDRSSMPLCRGCLRITVGTGAENSLLLEALSDYDQKPKKLEQ
jgi:histidinol-phosphate aminotransferase